jgi:purine-binding chemotaxis protein CheW
MAKDVQLVGLRIGRETYGVPIAIVREIVRVPEITAVPNAQEFVEGVINLRGKIISVVDLRKRFGGATSDNNKKNRVVVVELENRTVGLIVNAASEVLKIPPSEIEPPGSVFPEGEIDYVTGVGKLDGRLVILLDLNKVLKTTELRHLEELVPAASV